MQQKYQKQLFGLGLCQPHHSYVLKNRPKIDFFEIHTENFIARGGQSIAFLEKISDIYPLSFHSVGISIGSKSGICDKHLSDIKFLIEKFQPFLISDHLSWSAAEIGVSNDLLPIIYNKKSLEIFSDNLKKIQDFFDRNILIENPTAYMEFEDSDMSEVDFLNQLSDKTNCHILLDINNVFVTAHNFDFDAKSYLNEINHHKIKEIHLAGHIISNIDGHQIRIDTHSEKICQEVIELYQYFLQKTNIKVPTLIEWDENIPEFQILEEQLNLIKNAVTGNSK